jgi:hypothetical protein
MSVFLSPAWFLVAGAWYFLNGVLHDIFVLRAHKGAYDRDLLRLLLDGHILLLSGVALLFCWQLARQHVLQGPAIGLVIATGMVVYCLLIFPFLKSFVTLGISGTLAIACIAMLFKFTNP